MNFIRRPTKPTRLILSNLKYNHKTQLYERTQDGITYSMPLELTRHLKEWFRNFHAGSTGKIVYPTMEQWFNELSKEQKKQVTRTGNILKEIDDFFPDPEY